METIYGIISDIHTSSPAMVIKGMEELKQKGAEKLILNGDIMGEQFTYRNPFITPAHYLSSILGYASARFKRVYYAPGSHEEFAEFRTVGIALEDYPTLVECREPTPVFGGDHTVIILPGSDSRMGDAILTGFPLDVDRPTGLYIHHYGTEQVSNINDLRKLVTHPETTILMSHVPRRFKEFDTAVDVAYYGKNKKGEILPGVTLEGLIRQKVGRLLDFDEVQQEAARLGFEFHTGNQGNIPLAKICNELGITKAINGHFHESAHRAHDLKGPVKEDEPLLELFWNASYMDGLKLGLLHVTRHLVRYRNISLQS